MGLETFVLVGWTYLARGQPKNTASALEHQNDQPILSSDSSDTTVDYPDDPSPKKSMRKVKKKGSEKPTSTQKLKKRGRPQKNKL